jgi:hypothetical protein
MGKIFLLYLEGEKVYICSGCGTHLSIGEDVVSKSFTGKYGQAYLFAKSINTQSGDPEERQLMTGLHTVADLHCINCKTYLGWKYFDAAEEKEQYKIGKCVLECGKIKKEKHRSTELNEI